MRRVARRAKRGRPLSSGGPLRDGVHWSACGSTGDTLRGARAAAPGRAIFGSYDAKVAAGLQARHDHGSQYMSEHFQEELRLLGITSSPAFVREPEGNGVAERFIRTLKEQLRWVRTFETVEDLRLALLEFQERHNRAWLCERHGHQTPAAVRAQFTVEAPA